VPTSLWSPPDAEYQRRVLAAHDDLTAGTDLDDDRPATVRDPVLQSWLRSQELLPRGASAPQQPPVSGAVLAEARNRHVFSALLPMLTERIIEPAVESGLVVALGDSRGRLLWIDGPTTERTRAEDVGFVAGADWSEEAMGTNAPALALATGSAVQIAGAEHFVEAIKSWSCSAVPLLDPSTGEVLGVIDVTGDPRAVGPLVLPLLRSAMRAAQSDLPARRPDDEPPPTPRRAQTPAASVNGPLDLQLTGRRTAVISHSRGRVTACLSTRHAEILALLHLSDGGMRAGELAEALYGSADSLGTVRTEVLRLRRVLEAFAGDALTLHSRPYGLDGPLDSDLRRTRTALEEGDVDEVLRQYSGSLLPESDAPQIERLRHRISGIVRNLILERGDHRQLWRYARLPEAEDDLEVLMAVLAQAPRDSPERAAAAARAEAVEAEQDQGRRAPLP
jgi:hypothetical protein